MKLQTLDDLLEQQLQELYGMEQRLTKALPEMASASSSGPLRDAFEHHAEQTRGHVRNIEEVFRALARRPESIEVGGIVGVTGEAQSIVGAIEPSPLRDAALIGAARKVEHYEIAAYSAVISIVRKLALTEVAILLERNLQEETTTDKRLAEIADTAVTPEVLQLGAHQRGPA
jgi:ferritin-like metal-binding protein YciE